MTEERDSVPREEPSRVRVSESLKRLRSSLLEGHAILREPHVRSTPAVQYAPKMTVVGNISIGRKNGGIVGLEGGPVDVNVRDNVQVGGDALVTLYDGAEIETATITGNHLLSDPNGEEIATIKSGGPPLEDR